MRRRRWWLWIPLALVALIVVGPFLVPVPPLEDTLPPQELADADSRFVEVNHIAVHYKEMGSGERTFLLLHGFGASTFSWREVTEPLSAHGRVIAFDRPAFGLTERPLRGDWQGDSPYSSEAQVALTVGLMDALGIERVVLVGNSAGGTVSMLTALAHPERVEALVLVDPAVYTRGSPGWLRPILSTPQMRHLGPLIARRIQSWGVDFARSAWHDPNLITDEIWEGYLLPLRADNWDRALWELTIASRSSGLDKRLGEFAMPVLIITGDDDQIVPTADSVRLHDEMPGSELVIVEACGHIPHEECPDAFMQALLRFVESFG